MPAFTERPNCRPIAAPWRPLVICPHPEIGKRLAEALRKVAADPVLAIAEYPRAGTIATPAAQKGANICFLDVASNGAGAGADLRTGAFHSRGGVVGVQRRGPDSALPAPRRRRFRPIPLEDSCARAFERLGWHRTPVAHRPAGENLVRRPGKPGCGARPWRCTWRFKLTRRAARHCWWMPIRWPGVPRLCSSSNRSSTWAT